ncbi:MAG: YihY/virulence factor BrkB family protein [Longimonas sp.]|uniref:YihY/virulence factor BrkB family protein n=1 Tax=Longimonas sp. TaxID=2039626 RepID=UPI003359DB85
MSGPSASSSSDSDTSESGSSDRTNASASSGAPSEQREDTRLSEAVRRTAPLNNTAEIDAQQAEGTKGQDGSTSLWTYNWSRVQAVALYYIYGLVEELQKKDIVLWSQAIAFKVLITIVPILLLGIGLLGRVLRGDAAFNAVTRVVRDFLPEGQEDQVIQFLDQLQEISGAVIGIGGIGLFLSAFSLFITLRIVVRNAFAQTWHEERSILGGYLFDARMVLQVGMLFLATVFISFIFTTRVSTSMLASLGIQAPWLVGFLTALTQFLVVLLPFVITTAMFFQLYYLVPLPHPRKRSALVGAVVAAGMWEILKYAFTYYAVYVGRFERYAMGEESFSALGNTFGLMIAFVFWVYFSGMVFMLGAVVASLHEHRHVMAKQPYRPIKPDVGPPKST